MEFPNPRDARRRTTIRRCRWRWVGGLVFAGLALCGTGADYAAAATRIVNLNLYQQEDLRALAMGNAFGPVARGEAALQYNPAGLATYDFDLKADASVTFMQNPGSFITDTLNASSGSPTTQDIINYLTKYGGTTQTFVLQIFPSVVANLGDFYIGAGYGKLDVQRYGISFSKLTLAPSPVGQVPLGSLTLTEQEAQLGLGGLAVRLGGGKVLFGVTAKTVRYSEISSQQDYLTIIANKQINLNSLNPTIYSQVEAYDAGLIYRAEWLPDLKLQWSLTAYNIGGYTLAGTNPQGVVQQVHISDTYNFGIALQPDIGFVHIVAAAEVEDLTREIQVMDANGVNHPRSDEQHYRAGIEVGLFKTPTGNNWISLRAGTYQGYPTYGAELNLGGFLRAVYTTATENTGYQGHPQFFTFNAYQLALGLAW